MALVKSAIFSEMSGKYDGAVLMPTKFGLAMRMKVTPANPGTSAQLAARTAFANAVAAFFGTLTQAQRDAWSTASATVTRNSPLGDSFNLNGQQAYLFVNALRGQMGLAQVSDPPADISQVPVAGTLVNAAAAPFGFTYAAPAAGTPDAYANGGGLRLYLAYRSAAQHRRYGSWDEVITQLGAAVRPADDSLKGTTNLTSGDRVFYKVVAQMADGRPGVVNEGNFVVP
jgi:hypothetical protein